jgi:pimeloyl-ACP methyl ester carboxylesterase
MPQVLAKGMTVEYESIGDDHAPAMVLTVGLGAQLTAWPVPFCKRLTRQRFHVERFDNRSAGLSIKFDAVRAPVPMSAIAVRRLIRRSNGETSRKRCPLSNGKGATGGGVAH